MFVLYYFCLLRCTYTWNNHLSTFRIVLFRLQWNRLSSHQVIPVQRLMAIALLITFVVFNLTGLGA